MNERPQVCAGSPGHSQDPAVCFIAVAVVVYAVHVIGIDRVPEVIEALPAEKIGDFHI